MLQTIEVEIDAKGHIHPLEALPLPQKGKTRALLTILPAIPVVQRQTKRVGQEVPAFGSVDSIPISQPRRNGSCDSFAG